MDILEYLRMNGPKSVTEIAEATKQEQSAVSHNLKKLLVCSCVDMKIQGKSRLYSLNKETIVPILELANRHIKQYCQAGCKNCKGCEEPN